MEVPQVSIPQLLFLSLMRDDGVLDQFMSEPRVLTQILQDQVLASALLADQQIAENLSYQPIWRDLVCKAANGSPHVNSGYPSEFRANQEAHYSVGGGSSSARDGVAISGSSKIKGDVIYEQNIKQHMRNNSGVMAVNCQEVNNGYSEQERKSLRTSSSSSSTSSSSGSPSNTRKRNGLAKGFADMKLTGEEKRNARPQHPSNWNGRREASSVGGGSSQSRDGVSVSGNSKIKGSVVRKQTIEQHIDENYGIMAIGCKTVNNNMTNQRNY